MARIYYIWISWEESLFQKLLPHEPGILFSWMRILFSRQWSREFFWKECVIANLMDRNSISETHATRIRNSFLKKENSFRQAMKQRVLLERIFNRKSYEQDRNFRNSCHKNPEFFFFENDDSFWQANSRWSFWKKIFNCRSYEKNRNLRIH